MSSNGQNVEGGGLQLRPFRYVHHIMSSQNPTVPSAKKRTSNCNHHHHPLSLVVAIKPFQCWTSSGKLSWQLALQQFLCIRSTALLLINCSSPSSPIVVVGGRHMCSSHENWEEMGSFCRNIFLEQQLDKKGCSGMVLWRRTPSSLSSTRARSPT